MSRLSAKTRCSSATWTRNLVDIWHIRNSVCWFCWTYWLLARKMVYPYGHRFIHTLRLYVSYTKHWRRWSLETTLRRNNYYVQLTTASGDWQWSKPYPDRLVRKTGSRWYWGEVCFDTQVELTEVFQRTANKSADVVVSWFREIYIYLLMHVLSYKPRLSNMLRQRRILIVRSPWVKMEQTHGSEVSCVAICKNQSQLLNYGYYLWRKCAFSHLQGSRIWKPMKWNIANLKVNKLWGKHTTSHPPTIVIPGSSTNEELQLPLSDQDPHLLNSLFEAVQVWQAQENLISRRTNHFKKREDWAIRRTELEFMLAYLDTTNCVWFLC